MYEYVDKECGQVFDAPVLEETVVKVLSLMIEWLQLVFSEFISKTYYMLWEAIFCVL